MPSTDIANKFLIARLSTFDQPWTTPQWWRDTFPELMRAFNALEHKECFAVIIGEDGIRYLSAAEYETIEESVWIKAGGPEFEQNIAADVLETFRQAEAEKIERLRQPRQN